MASSGPSSTSDGQTPALGHHRFRQMQRKSTLLTEKMNTIKAYRFFVGMEHLSRFHI